MINKSIAIIGAGHIGTALFRGLVNNGNIKPSQFILASPHLDKLTSLEKVFKIKITTNNIEAIKQSDIIILSVRPKIMAQLISEIKTCINGSKIIISVAACVPINLLEKYFYPKILKIVRIMPNIPVAYGKGVVGWIGNKQIDSNDKKLVKKLLGPLGVIVACKDEESLDKLSMISGCGPGYVGYFINNLEKVARRFGFSQEESKKIVEATFSGTLHHLKASHISADELVKAVATKGGITEEVLKNLDANNFTRYLSKSIEKGYIKIKKITEELRKEN